MFYPGFEWNLPVCDACEPKPLCQFSSVHTVSALLWFLIGGDSNYACVPAATSVSTHFLYSSEGRNQTAALKANKPLFSCQISDNELSRMLGCCGGGGGGGKWTGGGVNKAWVSPQGGCSLQREDAVSAGTQQLNPGTLDYYNRGLITNRFNTPPQSWEVFLFTVAIETGLGLSELYVTVMPLWWWVNWASSAS